MKLRALVIAWVVSLVFIPLAASAQFVEIPTLTGPVVDQTGTLGSAAASLEQQLRQLKDEKGSEIAVLLVPSTKPETIEQYSIRVVEKWKLGRQGVDDGVLLLIALQDRTVRIEVGRGLEGDIPDVKAHRIIDELIIPRFRDGDVIGGIQAGVDSLVGLVRGIDLPPPTQGIEADYGILLPIFFFVYAIGGSVTKKFGRVVGALGGSALGFVSGLFLFSAVTGLVMATFCGLMIFIARGWIPTRMGDSGSGRSSGRGGSSSSSGSFGGGGSFSGGGSSGKW